MIVFSRHAFPVIVCACLALTLAVFDASARTATQQGAQPVKGATPVPKTTTPKPASPSNVPPKQGVKSKIIQTTEPEKNPSCSKGFVWCPASKGRGICMFRKCS